MKTKLLWLTFAGGALGSVLRYGLTLTFTQAAWLAIVNLVGAGFLGFANTSEKLAGASTQSFWGTGFAGGFTTMSSLITFALLGNDPNFYYVALQILLGLIAYAIGRVLGGGKTKWNS